MSKNIRIGSVGEDLACGYLRNCGYRIIGRNYRQKWGEIDIVSMDKDGTLVLVEVKTMVGNECGIKPEDNLTRNKLLKLIRICESFVNSRPDLINERKGWRIDLVTVTLPESFNLTYDTKNCVIKQYSNLSRG